MMSCKNPLWRLKSLKKIKKQEERKGRETSRKKFRVIEWKKEKNKQRVRSLTKNKPTGKRKKKRSQKERNRSGAPDEKNNYEGKDRKGVRIKMK